MTETPDPWTRGVDYREPTGIQMPVVINDPRPVFLKQDVHGKYMRQPTAHDMFSEMTVSAPRHRPVMLPVPLTATVSIPGPAGRQEIVARITQLDFNLSGDPIRRPNEDRPVLGTCYVRTEWESEKGQMTAWLQASLLCGDKLRRNGRPIVRWTRSPQKVFFEHLKREMLRVLESAREDPLTDLLGLIQGLNRAAAENLRS